MHINTLTKERVANIGKQLDPALATTLAELVNIQQRLVAYIHFAMEQQTTDRWNRAIEEARWLETQGNSIATKLAVIRDRETSK